MNFKRLFLFSACALTLAACQTISTERVAVPNTPVSYQFVSEMLDEETIEHTVKFRNIGNEVVSFDYTIADEPGVPHLDCLGPNSGLVENLYPGAEVEVKNPVKSLKGTFITLGRVTYGKRTGEQLAKQYKPSTLVPGAASGAATPLPLLEPITLQDS